MGDEVHNEEKPQSVGGTVSRRGLLEKGAMVAAVSAVPLSAGPARKTRIARQTAGKVTTLKLMSWFQYEPGRHEAWNTMISKFNKSQSKYKVVWTGWPANQYSDHVNTQVQAGGIDADVMTLIPDLAARLVQQGDVLAPINSIVKKVGVHPSSSHNYIRKDGNLYGISIVEVAFGLLYNKALLDKAGIKRPATDPQEWLQQTIKLTNKPNQFGLYSAQHDGRAVLVLVHAPGLGLRVRRQVGDRQEAQPDRPEGHQGADRSGRSSTTRRSRRARTTRPLRACSRTGRSPRS